MRTCSPSPNKTLERTTAAAHGTSARRTNLKDTVRTSSPGDTRRPQRGPSCAASMGTRSSQLLRPVANAYM
ncbi:hypothetical protein OH76DRAFT_1413217 [Lentinus brumalis]|uniref:Uncharacterized protein n=1 Tax=Lentinus brumalis TaxID=2498619 RepID=A0A371CIF2_9APHY|nr:hypothetical protein OH76DRAFT_1413217 [Polyporus brumalis]